MTHKECLDLLDERNYHPNSEYTNKGTTYIILNSFPSPTEEQQLGIFKNSLKDGIKPEDAINRFITRNDLEVYLYLENPQTGEILEGLLSQF